jgi:hypothetical protein
VTVEADTPGEAVALAAVFEADPVVVDVVVEDVADGPDEHAAATTANTASATSPLAVLCLSPLVCWRTVCRLAGEVTPAWERTPPLPRPGMIKALLPLGSALRLDRDPPLARTAQFRWSVV